MRSDSSVTCVSTSVGSFKSLTLSPDSSSENISSAHTTPDAFKANASNHISLMAQHTNSNSGLAQNLQKPLTKILSELKSPLTSEQVEARKVIKQTNRFSGCKNILRLLKRFYTDEFRKLKVTGKEVDSDSERIESVFIQKLKALTFQLFSEKESSVSLIFNLAFLINPREALAWRSSFTKDTLIDLETRVSKAPSLQDLIFRSSAQRLKEFFSVRENAALFKKFKERSQDGKLDTSSLEFKTMDSFCEATLRSS